MGLFLDRPAHMIDPKGFSACNNVRIELGRVRSDGIGWTKNGATITQNVAVGPAESGTAPIIYMDTFITSENAQYVFAVTPTDIIQMYSSASGYAMQWATPLYNIGTVAVNNGSTSVAGTGTRWHTDIQYGDAVTLLTNAALGATKLYISSTNTFFWPLGLPITDATSAIPGGTYIANTGTDGGGYFVTLSAAITIAMTAGDGITVGTVTAIRNNVRAGDYILFGATAPGNIGTNTWYQVASVTTDGALTLSTSYVGTNLSGSTYCVKQGLTDTYTDSPPTLPACSSDTYLAAAGYNGQQNAGANPATATNNTDIWFFTNGLDPVISIYVENGQTAINSLYVRSVPYLVNCLKQYRGLMVYGGLVWVGKATLLSSITSSDSGLPLQLNSGIAFQGIATGGPFSITRISVLGATMMLYGTGEWAGGPFNADNTGGVVTSASLVGFPTIWTFSDVVQTRGPIAGGAVAIFSDRHQFLAIDGQYRYNGLFIQVMNDHVWREVMKGFDITRPNACFATTIPTTGDLIWTIPQTTDPGGQLFASSAYVEHYMEQANSYLFKPFTKRDFPFLATCAYQPGSSFGQQAGNQPYYLAGDLQGNIWILYQSNLQNLIPPLCSVTWASRKIGNGRSRMLVTRVYPEIEAQASSATIDVTLTLQNYAAGPVLITDTQTFDPSYPNEIGWTTHFRRGAVASVTISDQAGVGWICDGYDWDYITGGVRLRS